MHQRSATVLSCVTPEPQGSAARGDWHRQDPPPPTPPSPPLGGGTVCSGWWNVCYICWPEFVDWFTSRQVSPWRSGSKVPRLLLTAGELLCRRAESRRRISLHTVACTRHSGEDMSDSQHESCTGSGKWGFFSPWIGAFTPKWNVFFIVIPAYHVCEERHLKKKHEHLSECILALP